MVSPQVSFDLDTYKDLAVCMDIQNSDFLSSEQISPEQSELYWSKLIKEWQDENSAGFRSIEEYTSLEDFKISAFFIEHPVPAILLRNIKKVLHALDDSVCGSSENMGYDKLAKWREMPLFEYLVADEVEKGWVSSLQKLTEDLNKDDYRDALLPRIKGMFSGLERLNEAHEDLQRGFSETLKGLEWGSVMLERVSEAVTRRYLLIEEYFKVDEYHQKIDSQDASGKGRELGMSSINFHLRNSLIISMCRLSIWLETGQARGINI
jgi:hypothetical protein